MSDGEQGLTWAEIIENTQKSYERMTLERMHKQKRNYEIYDSYPADKEVVLLERQLEILTKFVQSIKDNFPLKGSILQPHESVDVLPVNMVRWANAWNAAIVLEEVEKLNRNEYPIKAKGVIGHPETGKVLAKDHHIWVDFETPVYLDLVGNQGYTLMEFPYNYVSHEIPLEKSVPVVLTIYNELRLDKERYNG